MLVTRETSKGAFDGSGVVEMNISETNLWGAQGLGRVALVLGGKTAKFWFSFFSFFWAGFFFAFFGFSELYPYCSGVISWTSF